MLLHDACPSVMVMVLLHDDAAMLHAAKKHLSDHCSLFVLFAQVAQSARVVDAVQLGCPIGLRRS